MKETTMNINQYIVLALADGRHAVVDCKGFTVNGTGNYGTAEQAQAIADMLNVAYAKGADDMRVWLTAHPLVAPRLPQHASTVV